MSMFMVPQAHIDVMVTLMTRSELVPSIGGLEADLVGLGLWLENWNSGKARYPQAWGEVQGSNEDLAVVQAYRHRPVDLPSATTETGTAILRELFSKVVECYQYQACEHPTWRRSPAFAWTTELLEGLGGTSGRGGVELPGWPVNSHEDWAGVVANYNGI